MTPESRNSSLQDSGSLGTYPWQSIGSWENQSIAASLKQLLWRCDFPETDSIIIIKKKSTSMSTDEQQTFSMVTGDYISGREEKIHSCGDP
jgi:hypothetical protein